MIELTDREKDENLKVYTKIKDKARELNKYKDKNEGFIDYVNSLDKEQLRKIHSHYTNREGLANKLRTTLIEGLLEGKKISLDVLKEYKKELGIGYYWDDFKIFFGLWYFVHKEEVKEDLEFLAGKIRNLFPEPEKIDLNIRDFNRGSKNFGGDKCWISFYPKNNSQEHTHFHFNIDGEETYFEFCLRDSVNDPEIGGESIKMNYLDLSKIEKHIKFNYEKFIRSDKKNDTTSQSLAETPNLKQEFNYKKEIKVLKEKKQIILYGVSGTGKTYSTRKIVEEFSGESFDDLRRNRRAEFVKFHQSFTYEEFVEGIKAKIEEESKGILKSRKEKIKYEVKPGIFKRICNRAKSNKGNDYFLIIDEINRGDIPKIFGELTTLLEKDKRLGGEDETTINLLYSNQENFGVPQNLYIIATMNTSDKSSASFDVALRRRFGFIETRPNYNLIDDSNLRRFLREINDKILFLLDKNHLVGHSFFTNKKFEDLNEILFYEIIPLLEDYFHEDYEKIKVVLGEDLFGKFFDEKGLELENFEDEVKYLRKDPERL